MKNEKAFDAVRMMRQIRDKLSERFRVMSFEEQKRYMAEQIGKGAVTRKRVSTNDMASA